MGDAMRTAPACAVLAVVFSLPSAAAPKHGNAVRAVAALAARSAQTAIMEAKAPKKEAGAGLLASLLQPAAEPSGLPVRARTQFPEPVAFGIIGSALVALGLIRRRRHI